MKPPIYNKYQKRIINVLNYIESNLTTTLSLEKVAEQSHFSEFHFHRIFKGVMQETVNEYITRRKLERAINLLIVRSEMSITDIAYNSGYSSSANFAKAVKAHFNFSPSEIRNNKSAGKNTENTNSKIGKLFSKYGKDFRPSDLYPFNIQNQQELNTLKELNMKIEVKELNALNVCTLASEGGYQVDALFATWDTLIKWGEQRGIAKNIQTRFAFCFDNPAITPIEKCRYHAAIVLDEAELTEKTLESSIQLPFSKSVVPAGKYAVLYFKGAPEDAAKSQMALYSHWLPTSGYEPDSFPMLERYLNDVRQDGFVEMELYVKLKIVSD